MNKKIPKIFVNKIDKNIDNNTKVYYSYKDDFKEEYIEKNVDYFEIQNKINNLFKSSDFVYKKNFLIKTNNFEKEFIIISKSFNYLLTIDGYKILIKDIIDIKSL